MSTGHPGICLHVDDCLREDARLDLNSQIVQIYILKRIKPDSFWESYRYFYNLESSARRTPKVVSVTISDEVCPAIKHVVFPVYNKQGKDVGTKKLTVVFTDQVLVGTKYLCATIDQDGTIVGEKSPAV